MLSPGQIKLPGFRWSARMHEGSVESEGRFHVDGRDGEDSPLPSEEPKVSNIKATGNGKTNPGSVKNRTTSQFRASLEERFSRQSARSVSPSLSASSRRSKLQKQLEVNEAVCGTSDDPQEKGSITPAMRKKYLKELFLTNQSGLSSILSTQHASVKDCEDDGDGEMLNSWALDPIEHAWMLSTVDGNYDAMVEFLTEDPSLLSRKDFVSGFTALHWLAKNGKDETLIELFKYAEREKLPVNVNLRGSGGLTPLHVAVMHERYMVVKLLVGAFSAKIDVMDYNGKRAWQYLKESAPLEMKELLGAWDEEHSLGLLNANNSASQTQPEEQPVHKDEVDSSGGRFTRKRVTSSFRRLLYNVGLVEKI